MLVNRDYSTPFYVFSFASHQTITAVLLQKNKEGYEQLIAFFNKVLRDTKLKYTILEKQAYALVKALKAFKVYVLQSDIIAYVPTTVVKDSLVQGEKEGKRGMWITKIQEYELHIKLTNLIKGQGLAKILSESHCQALEINLLTEKGEAKMQ